MSKGFTKALDRLYDASGAGSCPLSGVTVKEDGIGAARKTLIVFDDYTFAANDDTGTGGWATVQLYDFPLGHLLWEGAVVDLAVTKSSAGVNDDWDGDVAVGTVAATDASAHSTTADDLIVTAAHAQAAAGATTYKIATATAEANLVFDGSATAKDAHLNILIDDADHDIDTTPCNLIFNGTVTLFWKNLGDN